jgi:plastocyanin
MRTTAIRGLSGLAIVAVLGLVGCASSDSGNGQTTPPESSSSQSPTTQAVTAVSIPIRFRDGQLIAPAALVKVSVGQPIDLVVTTDSDQEIHVHSTPEHEYHVKAGARNQTFEFTIDTPGTIEVESHTLDALIVKLQVS